MPPSENLLLDIGREVSEVKTAVEVLSAKYEQHSTHVTDLLSRHDRLILGHDGFKGLKSEVEELATTVKAQRRGFWAVVVAFLGMVSTIIALTVISLIKGGF